MKIKSKFIKGMFVIKKNLKKQEVFEIETVDAMRVEEEILINIVDKRGVSLYATEKDLREATEEEIEIWKLKTLFTKNTKRS